MRVKREVFCLRGIKCMSEGCPGLFKILFEILPILRPTRIIFFLNLTSLTSRNKQDKNASLMKLKMKTNTKKYYKLHPTIKFTKRNRRKLDFWRTIDLLVSVDL